MKKRISIILATLLMLTSVSALAGCGGKKDIEPGATVVTVWMRSFEMWNREHYAKVFDEINADWTDGVHIDYQFINEGAFADTLAGAQQNRIAPDIYQVSYQNLWAEYSNGTIKELNDLLPQSAWDDLKPEARDLVEYNGKLTAYPQLMEPSAVLYYNKDYLAAAGITKDPALWSFNDLYDACDALIDRDVTPVRLGKYPLAGFTPDQRSWSTMGLQNNLNGGLEPVTSNWDAAAVQTEGYKNYARFFRQLFMDGGRRIGGDNTPYNDHIYELGGEKVGLCITGSWAIAELMETYPEMKDKIGVAPIPTLTGDKSGVTATNGGWAFVVDKLSTKDAAVAKVLQYLAAGTTDADKERAYSFFESASFSKIIPRVSIQSMSDSRSKGDVPFEWIEVIEDIASKSIPEYIFSGGIKGEIAKLIEHVSTIANAGNFEAQLTTLLANAASEINTIIENDNLAGTNPRYTAS